MNARSVIDDPGLLMVLMRFRRSGQMKLLPREPLPVPSGFRVSQKTNFGNGTEFVLEWVDPEDFAAEISGYTIYAIGRKNNSIVSTIDTTTSPVRVAIGSPDDELVTFVLETRYKGGYQAGPEYWIATTDSASRPVGGGDVYVDSPDDVSPDVRTIFVVSSIPPANDSSFLNGHYALNTTNGKLYKKTSTGWVETSVSDYLRTIQTVDIANGAVVGAHIANATITGSKIANATILGSHIAAGTISGTNIANATISSNHILSGSITGDHIAMGAITGYHIGTGVITGTHIANGTITGSNIASATISGSNIGSGTITGGNIATGTITGDKIANGAINANHIQNLTITAEKIANLTITTDKIGSLNLNTSTISNLFGNKLDGTDADKAVPACIFAYHIDVRNNPFTFGSGTVYCTAVSAYNWGVNDSGHATFHSGQSYSWHIVEPDGLSVGNSTVKEAAFRTVGVNAGQVTPAEHKHTVTVTLGQYTTVLYYKDWDGNNVYDTVVTGVYVHSVTCSNATT